jgi:release factor glutamine methyltransferase
MDVKTITSNLIKRTCLNSLDIELILAYILKKSREFILTHAEHKISKSQENKINDLIKKRLGGLPLAYILGYKEFYGLKFIVNKNVLIPRPETELMVDETLNLVSHISHPVSFVDVGTGSGCIAITLAKEIKNSKIIAIDISSSALNVAKGNAKLHRVKTKIQFLQGNLLEPIIKNNKIVHRPSSIVICANLPYLSLTQIKNSLSIKYEPKIALEAGPDGLKFYKKLFKQSKQLFNLTPTTYHLLCEIDPCQKNKIITIIKKELPKANFQIKKDLKGHSRLVIIKLQC